MNFFKRDYSNGGPIFIHEDFYRQIELIPRENYFATLNQIGEIQDIQVNSDSFKCVSRNEHIVQTSDKLIKLKRLRSIFSNLATSHHKIVTTGYSTHVENLENTVVWGFERIGFFVEYDKSLVKNIWLGSSAKFSKESNSSESICEALSLIAEIDLILVDWNQEIIVDIRSKKQLEKYLSEVLGFDTLN